MTRKEQLLWDKLKELEERLSAIEQMPRPIIFAVGKYYPEPVPADCMWPSELEH